MLRRLQALYLALLTAVSFASDSELIFRVPSDYMRLTEERYFQMNNFSSTSSLFISPPASIQPSARFGESLDSFRHRDRRYVLIGAPRHRNNSGAVFLCPFNASAGGAGAFTCESTSLPLAQPKGADPDNARGMLLGSSVAAITSDDQEGFGLYCGHLYRQTSPPNEHGAVNVDYKGLCNLLPMASRAKGAVPLSPCVASSCLAGFSSDLALSQEGGKNLVLAIGAPNLEKGKGQVLVSRVPLDSPRKPDRFHFSHIQDSTGSSAFYRGYDTAFAFEGRQDRLAISTPSDFPAAQIELFGGLLLGGTHLLQRIKGLKANGGEGFGLSLTSMHLTGGPNQRIDFAVGEPFFTGPASAVDAGRVLVFCRSLRQRSQIVGPEPNGRFGASVAAVPDLNGDGLDELAVGCPYCDEGRGAIFLFLGTRSCNFSGPAQVILARSSQFPLRQLGSALSAGTDVDGNGAVDLVIGAPASNRAVLARARAAFFVTSSVAAGRCVVMTDRRQVRDCQVRFNFDLRRATKHDTAVLDVERFRLRCSIDLDSLKTSLKRLQYKGKFALSYDLALQRRDASTYSATVLLKTKNFKADPALQFDKTTPLNMSTSVRLIEVIPGRLPMPRLEPQPGVWSKDVVLGNLACGMRPCEADFAVEVATDRYARREVVLGSPNVTLIVHVRNWGPELDDIDSRIRLTFENGLTPLKVSSEGPEAEQPSCSSAGENVEVCDLEKSFGGRKTLRLQVDMDALALTQRENWPSLLRPPRLLAEVLSSSLDPHPSNNSASFSLRVLYAPRLVLTASATSQQTVVDRRNSSSPIRARERVHVGRIGPQIRQLFHLANQGPSDVYNLTLSLRLPVASALGERLLYLAYEVRVDGNPVAAGPRIESESGKSHGSCEIPPELVNPLNLTIVSTSRRVRREAPVVPSSSSSPTGGGQDRLECGTESRHFGPPRCAVIRCQLDQLLRKDSVRIVMEAWLWSDTVLRRHVSDIEVVSAIEGNITFVPPIATALPGSLTIPVVNQSTHVVFPNVKISVKNQLPIWIIVCSVLIGVLLLSLIILCLRQVGFFKRRRHQPYATHVRRFQKYGGSSDLDLDDEDDDEAAGSKALLPSVSAPPKGSEAVAVCGSMDTGISEAPNSSASSPSQALERRDRGYESPGKFSDGSL